MTGPRIVTLDIETSPIVAYVWSLWKVNIGLNQIVDEWSILSYCIKDLGKKKISYVDTSRKANPRDDYALLVALHADLSTVDIVIAQNGKAFDMKKINARFIEKGMAPLPPIKVIDTMLAAKEVAKFTSNKLEWLSKHLTDTPKYAHSEFPGMELWTECLKGNPEAWKAMRRYNIPDILACRALYLKLRPWVTDHPNLNVYNDETNISCPRCQSTDLAERGFQYTSVGKYQRYQCRPCLGWTRSRFTLNTTAKRKSLLK